MLIGAENAKVPATAVRIKLVANACIRPPEYLKAGNVT
jgi:hypothetical protein